MGYVISKAQILNLAETLRPLLESSITPLMGVKSKGSNRKARQIFFGTGTYFSYLGFPFILTAQHVVEQSAKFDTYFHGTGNGHLPVPLRSLWVAPKDSIADIAIWGCFQSALDDAGITPLPYKDLLVPSYSSSNALYIYNVFPDSLKSEFPFMDEIMFAGNPIIGQQTTLPAGGNYDESIHFAIEYPNNVPPPGMSGSPVWNLRLHCMSNLESWSPEAVSFAGIVHRWHKGSKKVIATKVETIRDFIPNAVNHLRTTYNWKNGDE